MGGKRRRVGKKKLDEGVLPFEEVWGGRWEQTLRGLDAKQGERKSDEAESRSQKGRITQPDWGAYEPKKNIQLFVWLEGGTRIGRP